MQRTELHFTIDAEGAICSVVKGAKGGGCKLLIEEIKKLGQPIHESPTGEFYENEQGVRGGHGIRCGHENQFRKTAPAR